MGLRIVPILLLAAVSARAEILINEIHYNPGSAQGADSDYEFFELHNSGAAAVDLTGWTIDDRVEEGHNAVTHAFAPGTTLAAGGYLVLAIDAAAVEAWYGISGVVQWDAGELDNGDDPILVRDASSAIVDEVFYDDGDTGWPASPDGDGPSLELINPALDNAPPANWAASANLGGTPGAANSVYAADALPVVTDLLHAPQSPTSTDPLTLNATIVDDEGVASATLRYSVNGGVEQSAAMSDQGGNAWSAQIGPFADGSLLAIAVEAVDLGGQTAVFPAEPGDGAYHLRVQDAPFTGADLVINEIQYTDACFGGLDWFELYNATDAEIDLSFWTMKDNQDDHVFQFHAGTTIAAGGYLAVAQSAAELVANYGIANVVGDVADGLGSGGDAVRIYDVNLALVDEVWYGVTAPWPGAPVGTGPSLSLMDPALDNNDGASWQPSAAACGTPGSDNGSDAFAPVAIQAGILPSDLVRVIFNEAVDPTTATMLGNYLLDGVPATGASLLDATTVELDFGVSFVQGQLHDLGVSGVEDLAGNEMAPASFALSYWPAGSVVINEILQNPSAVGDAAGEWFELANPNAFAVNLRGWTLKDDGSDLHTISPDADLLVPAGGYLVLGASADPLVNGGAPVDYSYGTGMSLGNGADEIVLVAGLVEIDRVDYDGGSEFPDPNGASMELVDWMLDNGVGANWTVAVQAFGDGDFGTPGAANGPGALETPVLQVALDGSQVELSWTPVAGAGSYRVEVAATLGGPFVELATVVGVTYDLTVDPGQPVRLLRVVALQ